MAEPKTDIDDLIKRLLADPDYEGHPLHEGLSLLWELYLTQLRRLDRIAHLSDRVQWRERNQTMERTEQFEKRLRQLERMTRISDRYQNMMRQVNEELERASTHDTLTSLPNRRLLDEQLSLEIARSRRQQTPLCVCLLDIDHFKRINDEFGHVVGDQALCAAAQLMRDAVRDCDICGRWGGEEFLLILPTTTPAEGRHIVQRIVNALRESRIDGLPDDFRIGISVGLTAYRHDERPEEIVARADKAMLDAKRAGRGQIKAVD